jgi:hypothetical protein
VAYNLKIKESAKVVFFMGMGKGVFAKLVRRVRSYGLGVMGEQPHKPHKAKRA